MTQPRLVSGMWCLVVVLLLALSTVNGQPGPYAGVVKEQVYQGELQNGTVVFVPVREAFDNVTRTVAGVRFKVMYDPINGKDIAEQTQCGAVGATVNMACSVQGNGRWLPDKFVDTSCTVAKAGGCAAEDIIVAGTPRMEVLQQRVAWAALFVRIAVKQKVTTDNIQIDPAIVSRFGLATSFAASTDVVLIVTARPVPEPEVEGYAACLQQDQWGRCTVGAINIVPSSLSANERSNVSTVAKERANVLRQILHVVAGVGMAPSSVFVDFSGQAKSTGVYFTNTDEGHYRKITTKIRTQRVVDAAKKYFGCDSLTGVPLEDDLVFKGVLWESRWLGPEVMSGGQGAGDPFLSPITLAFLEDTNHYIVDYKQAGSLTRDLFPGTDPVLGQAMATKTVALKYIPPTHLDGYTKWGAQAGCEFLQQSAGGWPAKYSCKGHTPQQAMCSYDSRFIASCGVQTGISMPSSKEYSCGFWTGSTMACTAMVNDACSGGSCKLPSMYQYFTSGEAISAAGTGASAANTGGPLSAVDFAPVAVNLWSCQTSPPVFANSATHSSAGASSVLASISQVAGQSHCETCRCMPSTLSTTSTPLATQSAGCIRTNCFTPNYLQLGVVVDGKVQWQRCPTEGGRLVIKGLSGYVQCPPSAEFCSTEKVTGMRYDDNTPTTWANTAFTLTFAIAAGLVASSAVCCFFFKPQVVAGTHHFSAAGFTKGFQTDVPVKMDAVAEGSEEEEEEEEGEGVAEVEAGVLLKGSGGEVEDIEDAEELGDEAGVHPHNASSEDMSRASGSQRSLLRKSHDKRDGSSRPAERTANQAKPAASAPPPLRTVPLPWGTVSEDRGTHLKPLLQPQKPGGPSQDRSLPASERMFIAMASGTAWGAATGMPDEEQQHVPKPFWEASDRPANLVQCVNSCALCLGLVIVIMSIVTAEADAAAVDPVIAMCCFMFAVSLVGVVGACGYCCDLLSARGRRFLACLGLVYFYIACAGLAILTYSGVAIALFQDQVYMFLDDHWDVVVEAYPGFEVDYQVTDITDPTPFRGGGGAPGPGSVIAESTAGTADIPGGDFVLFWLLGVVPVGVIFCCLSAGGVLGTCCLLPRFTLLPSIATIYSYMEAILGVVVLIITVTAPSGSAALELAVTAVFGEAILIVSALATVTGLCGLAALFRKSRCLLSTTRTLLTTLIIACVVYAVLLFIRSGSWTDEWVDSLSPMQHRSLAVFAGAGAGVTLEGMRDSVKALQQAFCLALLMVVTPTLCLHLGSLAYFRQAVVDWLPVPVRLLEQMEAPSNPRDGKKKDKKGKQGRGKRGKGKKRSVRGQEPGDDVTVVDMEDDEDDGRSVSRSRSRARKEKRRRKHKRHKKKRYRSDEDDDDSAGDRRSPYSDDDRSAAGSSSEDDSDYDRAMSRSRSRRRGRSRSKSRSRSRSRARSGHRSRSRARNRSRNRSRQRERKDEEDEGGLPGAVRDRDSPEGRRDSQPRGATERIYGSSKLAPESDMGLQNELNSYLFGSDMNASGARV